MQRDTVPSEWDSPPASPSPKSPVRGKTTGRDIPLINIKSFVSRQHVAASATHSSVPDGLCRVRYRAPDKDLFVFDVATGYRFDPTTGLHYDANSGFFINHKLELLLRWDPLSNTYKRAGDFAGLGKPMAIPSAVRKVAASVLLGSKPSPNLKTTSVEGSKTRKPHSEKVTGSTKKKREENAAESRGSKRKSKDEVLPKDKRCKRNRSRKAKPGQQMTRAIDRDASRSKSSSPARQNEDSREMHVGRSRSRSPASNKQSKCRSRIRRSVSMERNTSRKNIREARRSSSMEPRRSQSRKSERRDFRESRRSQTREAGRSYSRGSQISDFREHRRSRSRGRRRSRGRVTKRSPSRSTRNSHSRVTRRSFGREIDWSISCSPSSVKIVPRSRSSSVLSRRVSSDRMRHDRSHSRGTKRKSDIQNHLGQSPKRKILGSTDHSPSNSQSEDETSVDIQRMKRRTLIRETPEFIVIDTDDETREETPEETPKDTVIDRGDVLGHLFTNCNQILTNILLVAPVPLQNQSDGASDALKNQIGDPEGLLEVYVNHEKTSGSPCHFMVISFKSANTAKQWYNSHSGTILLSGEGSKLKGYLHFLKDGNWNCKYCKSFNFFMQSICPKCYRAKDGGVSPVSISEEPTKLVGVTKLKGNFSTVESVTESLPPLNAFNILRTEMIREPTGLSLGLCIFEVESSDEGSKLREYFLRQERIAVYVNEKPKTPDEVYLDVLFGKVSPTNILHAALVPLLNITDMQLELSLMEIYLLMLLKEDGIKYNEIALHVDENVGAPYSYALITFADAEAAKKWLESRRSTFDNVTASNQRSKISVHFSEDDWGCQGCHILNFSLRPLCHRCFKHKEQNRLGPISESLTHTRWVAVSKFSNWLKVDEDLIADFRALLKEFAFKRIEVVRDSKCQRLPLACVFEMHSKIESRRLKEYLAKEGRFSVFAVMHKELNGRTSDDPCDAPDLIIVEESPPECIDLTAEDSITEGYAEFAGASNIIKPAVGQQPPTLMDVPVLMTPNDEQPPPLHVSYTVPVKHPADIISVGPVPYPGVNAKKFYTQLFFSDGAKCQSVEFCNQNDFGVSYNYCIVYFSSPQSANDWFNKRLGSMKICYKTFPNIIIERFEPVDAYFHFLGGNWLCNCGIKNSPTRSICFKCYRQRGEAVAPLENSSTPTKYVGVKLFRWYSANELAYTFSTPRCTLLVNIYDAKYEMVKIRYVSDPMISRDDFGVYVFETRTLTAAKYLRDYCKLAATKVKSTGFVELKDPTAGAITELDYAFKPVVPLRIVNNDHDFDLISGNMAKKPFILGKSWKMVCPDYETFLWTSFYESRLNNPPTNVVLISLSPGDRHLPGEARAQIQGSLRKAQVNCKSICYSFKGDVGSPFSYCSIIFDSQNSAKIWFDKCKGTFKFIVPDPDDKTIILNFRTCFSHKSTSQSNTSYFIKSKLHYFLPNWLCCCGTSNFPLRSVCHKCLVNRRENSVYSSCTYPTNFVGIRLAKYFSNLDVSHFAGMRKLGYKIYDAHICLDRYLPRDPCGVIIFSAICRPDAVKLHKFLTGLIKKRSTHRPVPEELMAVLNESRGISYMMCQISLQSTWSSYQSENWDTFFNNEIPTNIIAIYHHHLTGTPPFFNIPIEPFGGTIQKFKRGGGFTATFWLICFPRPENAEGWYAANRGILRNKSNQLNLYFTQSIWTCAQCFSPNFPARVLCHKCYAHKIHGYSPLRLSASPTRWVGITSLCDNKEAFASLENTDFKFRSVRFITDPLVRLDGPSVLVFEVSAPAVGMELLDFFATKKLPAAFFVVHESSESIIDIDP